MGDAYGGFAKGMPKNIVKLPLVKPVKSLELRGASVSADRSSWSVTNRIVQPNHWSLAGCGGSGAGEGKGNQTQPNEHGVGLVRREEWEICASHWARVNAFIQSFAYENEQRLFCSLTSINAIPN